ncbi:hypothetical protein SAMN04488134_101763 [Amphibacillus marinus]|uniref:Uncharacterized protein n=1 Tax=Amphibacillus marinus TaxID=872970 RepID=A0A1H8IYF4_9BACI|nr:hypothetical protein [Amphibacillus marinus]SEN73225.1 hypothetical protein SAMN04488134_101763 [Amphibacillus marinus]
MTWGEIGSIVGSLSAAGSFLIWLYKKLVQEPDQKIREKTAEDLLQADQEQRMHMEKVLLPISDQIQRLNENLEESRLDRIRIHERLDHHKEEIVGLDKRFTKIEHHVFEGGDKL